MPRFTPGPWRVGISFHEKITSVDAKDPDGRGIVEVCAVWGDQSILEITPVSKANARLIAASPEMYALARKLVKHADAEFDDPGGIADLVEEARAILDRVDGEA